MRSQERFDRYERLADWPMLALGLGFLVVLILPLAQPLSPEAEQAFATANNIIWAIFVIDYLTRLALAPQRWPFVRTHILDLIVIAIPFLRPLRVLRVLAILISTTRRVGGLVVRQVTLYVIGVAVVIMSASAVVVFDSEKSEPERTIQTLGDALWWAAATVTTVGYGDVSPKSATGRLLAVVLMVVGIALLGTITAAVAAWFVNIVRRSETAAADEHEAATLDSVLADVRALRAEVAELKGTASPQLPTESPGRVLGHG